VERLKQQLSSKVNQYMSVEKGEELQSIIAQIQDEKHELEDVYFRMHSEFGTLHHELDTAQLSAETAKDLLGALKRERQSELSDRLIDMGERLKDIRLGEMKAKREYHEIKEKHTYLAKLLKAKNDQVTELEQKSAEYESKMHKLEEEFRARDNERLTKLFSKADGSMFADLSGRQGNQVNVGQAFGSDGHAQRDRSQPPPYAVHESVGD
jgi:chromosome segregation ATPase